MKKIILLIYSLSAFSFWTMSQEAHPLSFAQYLSRVAEGNLSYASEKLNVPIAQAQELATRTFNDPTLEVNYNYNEDHILKMGQGVEVGLSKTFSFGKRAAAMSLAHSESAQAEAQLQDYFRLLRANAALIYLRAVRNADLLQAKQDCAEMLSSLASADSLRCALGEIGEVDATQSRLEARIVSNETLDARSEWLASLYELGAALGEASLDTVFCTSASLEAFVPRLFCLDSLVAAATRERADIKVSELSKELSEKNLTLVRRERRTDVDLSVSVSHNSRVKNIEAPAPMYTGLTFGVAIPLKFSAHNKGPLRAASARITQAELDHRQAKVEIGTEVRTAYSRYESAKAQLSAYQSDLISQGKQVLEGKLFSYRRGEASLLEVISAQRAYADLRTSYIEALYTHAAALIDLETAAGIWDVG